MRPLHLIRGRPQAEEAQDEERRQGSDWPGQRLKKVELTGDPWRTRISADATQRGDDREASGSNCVERDEIFDGLTAALFQLAQRPQ